MSNGLSRSGKYQVALKDILEELRDVEADIEAINAKIPIDPAKEGGNLASISSQLDITLSALRDALRGYGTKNFSTLEEDIEDINAKIPSDPAREGGNLASILTRLESLTKALESLSQDALLTKQQDIDLLLRTLLNTPLARLAIDSAGRLRIIIDVAGTATPVSQSGTWNLGNFPVDQRWELTQRANIEYVECQRNKFTFT